MAKSTKINVPICPKCSRDLGDSGYCYKCYERGTMISRDKIRVSGEYTVVDWFSSRSSAGLIIADADGNKYPLYMSDVFQYLDGTKLGNLTLEETKKGQAYGWCVISEKEAV